jgi:hypothetical protein
MYGATSTIAGMVDFCLTEIDEDCAGTKYSGLLLLTDSGSSDVFYPAASPGVSGASVMVVSVPSRGSRK